MHFTRTLFFLVLVLLLSGHGAAGQFQVADTSMASIPDTVIISQLIITGNKVTRMPIVMREMVFHEKDTLARMVFEKASERTQENLMNTGLFNFVTITSQRTGDRSLIVIVDLKERWYIFPVPIFELVDRNFNEWIKSGDLERVNYGFFLNWDNFRGRNESVRFQFRWGYSQRIGIFYSIPYINKNQEEGLAVGVTYSRNRETGYNIEKSKLQLFTNLDEFVRKEIYGGLRYTHRSGFYNTGSFFLEYRNNTIGDTIAALNPDYLGDGKTSQDLITLAWQFRRDKRDYKIYPLKGYLFDFDVVKNGMGLMKNEPNLLFFTSQYKYFHKFNNRWYGASSVKGKISGKSDAPFFNERALGYGNELVRGYEYYVIPGQHYLLSRNTIKFALVPTRVVSLPFIILEKFRTIPYAFYLNANFDAAYVHDRVKRSNPLANSWQYGYGVGLDYVSYYNLVFRVEYSFNKFGENGFFIHFTAPI